MQLYQLTPFHSPQLQSAWGQSTRVRLRIHLGQKRGRHFGQKGGINFYMISVYVLYRI